MNCEMRKGCNFPLQPRELPLLTFRDVEVRLFDPHRPVERLFVFLELGPEVGAALFAALCLFGLAVGPQLLERLVPDFGLEFVSAVDVVDDAGGVVADVGELVEPIRFRPMRTRFCSNGLSFI